MFGKKQDDIHVPREATVKRARVIDMERMLQEITAPPEGPEHYAPKNGGPVQVTALQSIANVISRLTWADAEVMGKAIEEKIKSGKSPTAAIQEWAHEQLK